MSPSTTDVIIAVHTASRPIRRAVRSVIDHNGPNVRVMVVAHNIDLDIIKQNLEEYADHPRVAFAELRDGIGSPAGPMNLGLELSAADFVSVMGSDDELEPGTVDSWLALQQKSNADAVLTTIRHVGGVLVRSPPARPWRRMKMDAVKDRLAYRSAPLGLISRTKFPDVRFSEGLASGEDLPFSTFVWFTAKNLAFDRTGPAYLVHDDAEDRVTAAPRPIDDDFVFLDLIIDSPWGKLLSRQQKTALAVKLLRMHVLDAVVNRESVGWNEGERQSLSRIILKIQEWSQGPENYLSALDYKVIDGIVTGSSTMEQMMSLIRLRWEYRSPAVILPRNPFYFLHRQGPLRTYIAAYLMKQRRSR